MPGHLPELFRTSAKKIIGESLSKMVGEAKSVLLDDAQYRQRVVDPAWQELPLPCRILGRRRLGWDELFNELRQAAYEPRGATVQFRADVSMRTAEAFKQAVAAVEDLMQDSATARATESALRQPAASPDRTTAGAATATAKAGSSDDSAPAIGIDLGTTYSAVAYVDAHGRPTCIPNASGDVVTPSVVLFEEGSTVVGEEALMAAPMEPDRVAACVKRDMGHKTYSKQVNGENLPPEVISSLVLRSLKADAERRFGPVTKVVITVPAYFDEPRRKATMDAGRLAGLEVLDIINEPTAAALSYGYQLGFLDPVHKSQDNQLLRVFVYDLGGGTFDVTILEIRGNSFKAIATDGDVRLGGKDWDEKLIDLAAAAFLEQHGDDPRTDPSTYQELSAAAETAKKTLTERSRAVLYVNHFGKRTKFEVTREEFERATAALVNLTRTTSEIVLRQAGLTWDDIDRLLLVGGSTRMPMIVRMLEQLSGKPVDQSLAPDEAVAHGAALYADLLLKQRDTTGLSQAKFTLTNINSHSLGIVGIDERTKKKINHILIPKNTPLPCAVEQMFKTAKPNQQSVKVEVLEGENSRPEYCTLVGVSVVRNLPKDLAAGWPVNVGYRYEENGRLQVTAKVKGREAPVTATFVRDHNLPEDDLLAWSEYVAHESRLLSE